jgi:hypothetical protein
MSNNGTMTDYSLPSILPFMFVWAHAKRIIGKGKNKRTYHVIGYGAYNAFGMIGTEKNGIAICSVDDKCVITDEIAIGHVGACGTDAQRAEFKRIAGCGEAEFKEAWALGRSRIA